MQMASHSIAPHAPSIGAKDSRRRYFLALAFWLISMLIGQGLGAGRELREQVEKEWNAGQLSLSVRNVWRSVRTYFSDSDDIRRYYSYTNALLCKPYHRYYVKTSESWRDEFKLGKNLGSKDTTLVIPDRPLIPYRDYLVEYPPGVFLVTIPPALLLPGGDHGDAYTKLFIAEMVILLAAATALVLRLLRRLGGPDAPPNPTATAMWFVSGLGYFCLGTAAAHRFDPLVAFLLIATAWSAFEQSWVLFGVLLALAIVSKGIPLLVAPVWLFYVFASSYVDNEKRPWPSIGKALLGGVLCVLPFVILLYYYTGLSILDALRYHADRPLQVESTGSAILGTLQAVVPGTLRTEFSFGSHNVVASGDRLAGLQWVLLRMQGPVVLLGLATLLFLTWQRTKQSSPSERQMLLSELTLRVVCVVLVLYMVSGRVFSPQYLTWIVPLGLFLSLRVSQRLATVLLVTLLLTQMIWRGLGSSFEVLRPWAFFVLLVRNSMLLGWGLGLWLSQVPLTADRGSRPS